MPFLILDGERYALDIGETTLGGAGESALPSPVLASLPPAALISHAPDHVATIRRADPAAEVTLDGVPLDGAPRPLRHGARIAVCGHQLYFGDLRQSGSTSHVATVSDDQLAQLGALPAEPTLSTGGRLIVLGDGREVEIPAEGIEIGRDPECGIVLEWKEVSRRHAVIAPGLFGYVLTDTSANGVLVNGARVDGTRVLGRGDIIRVGNAELRFEAEAAAYEPDPSLRPPDGATGPDVGGLAAAERPGPGPASAVSLLATLEILNEGVTKGTRFRIERPLVHIGRGDHNDIVLRDGSVSGDHATLQRRPGGWFVIDAGSRNGTYADGERVTGERQLRSACELRFGNIKTVFRPIAGAATGDGTESTRSIVGIADERLGSG